jgi:hypothetical protein
MMTDRDIHIDVTPAQLRASYVFARARDMAGIPKVPFYVWARGDHVVAEWQTRGHSLKHAFQVPLFPHQFAKGLDFCRVIAWEIVRGYQGFMIQANNHYIEEFLQEALRMPR